MQLIRAIIFLKKFKRPTAFAVHVEHLEWVLVVKKLSHG